MAYRGSLKTGFPPRVQLPPFVWKRRWQLLKSSRNCYEKDPPRPTPSFRPSLRQDDGIVPIDHVVKITHYLMLAYNHCHRTLDAIEDDRTRESLVNGLRAMQIAWGQADALSLALERSTSLH